MVVIGWIATALSLIGAVLNARKNIYGYWLWIVANAVWLVISVIRKDWAQVVLWVSYIIITSYGIYCWSRNKE